MLMYTTLTYYTNAFCLSYTLYKDSFKLLVDLNPYSRKGFHICNKTLVL